MPTGIIYNTPHPSPFCEERCDGVSEADCLTLRSAAAVECCGCSCSRCDVCLVRRSECLGCAVLSSWWPLKEEMESLLKTLRCCVAEVCYLYHWSANMFVLPRMGKLKHNPKDKLDKLNTLVICRLRCHDNHWGLTKIICSSWNNDICILLRLVEIRNVLMIKYSSSKTL